MNPRSHLTMRCAPVWVCVQKGFPLAETTLEDVKAFFKPLGAVQAARLRTYKDAKDNNAKKFKVCTVAFCASVRLTRGLKRVFVLHSQRDPSL